MSYTVNPAIRTLFICGLSIVIIAIMFSLETIIVPWSNNNRFWQVSTICVVNKKHASAKQSHSLLLSFKNSYSYV